jgi:hypothetical protein
VAEGHAFCATHKHIADSLQRTGHVSAESKRRAYVSLTPKEKRKLLPRGQRGSTGRKVTVRQMTPEEMAALV